MLKWIGKGIGGAHVTFSEGEEAADLDGGGSEREGTCAG